MGCLLFWGHVMKRPVFQPRHYKAIAATIAKHAKSRMYPVPFEGYVEAWADMLWRDNPRFDRARFIAAAYDMHINGRDKVP